MRRLLFAAALAGCWSAARPAAPRRDITLALDVETAVLPNGLHVVVVPEPHASEVAVTMRYGVGSSDDPEGREGMAHLVEHLMFEHARGDGAVFDDLERQALGFNGYTTLDATIYTERALPAQLPDLLELEAARLQQACSEIPAAAFARQREIVRNELRERSAGDAVTAALRDAVFTHQHPFGGRRATPDTIAAITQDEACAFAAAHAGPGNTVAVISGHTSLADARALIDRTLGAVPPTAAQPVRVLGASLKRRISVAAPVDRAWTVFAWPLPEEPGARARLRAVAEMARTLIGARVSGAVTTLELGGGAARAIAIAVSPGPGTSLGDAQSAVRTVLTRMSQWLGTGLYEQARSGAVHDFAASLDHSVERDLVLAEDVLAGRDPRATVEAVGRQLAGMSRSEADALIDAALDPGAAAVVSITPSGEPAGGDAAGLAADVHEARRRKAEDPAEAHRPADPAPMPEGLSWVRVRTLANGLRVVLLPIATMPTLDIRLVFSGGSADEPDRERGIALVAAHALLPPNDPTALHFIQAGGRLDPDVDFDHTTFAVRGMAADLDTLLAGLAETVRVGGYDGDVVREVRTWADASAKLDRADAIAVDVWRQALYGDHPYRAAGLWQHANRAAIDLTALARFRAAHYRPDGATLILAGRFDPEDATQWIDAHFGDWSGAAPEPPEWAPEPSALAFAQDRSSKQIDAAIAFAVPADQRVAGLVAAEMVDAALADVREELAASYGLHAQLTETRLALAIQVTGSVDAARAAEAFALVRKRLAGLRESTDETAGRFVAARRHVLARLSSIDTRAAALADRAVAVDPTRWHPEAQAARNLTIEQLAPLLAKVELENAAMLLRGPAPAVAAAYAALGRRAQPLD